MAKQIQITLDDEDFREAKAQADMRHWEVERWIEFSLRHVARCLPHSSEYKRRKPVSAEQFRKFIEEVSEEDHPNPDDVDRILREQMLREIKSSM